jgi:protein-S-isoprenylcysteine O-methyltransferase Ste14
VLDVAHGGDNPFTLRDDRISTTPPKIVVTTPAKASSKNNRIVGWLLVAVQAVLLAAVFLTTGSTRWTAGPTVRLVSQTCRAVGFLLIAISAIELGRALTAHPSPKRTATLRSGGLYRLMRHPMYTGVMALSIGSALPSGSALRALGAIGLTVLFNIKSRFEERALAEHFADYPAYANVTPRFIPSPAAYRRSTRTSRT